MDRVTVIRQGATRFLVLGLWAQIPLTAILWTAQDLADATGALAIMAVAALAATVAWLQSRTGQSTRYVVSVAWVLAVSSLVYAFRGHPWQLDWHMYYFAALAMLAGMACWRSVLVAAALIAVHHLSLNFLLPEAIYPGGSNLSRVVLHAVFVVMETAVLCWLVRAIAQSIAEAEASVEDARAAHAEAESMAEQARRIEAGAHAERQSLLTEIAGSLENRIDLTVGSIRQSALTMRQGANDMFERASHSADQSSTVAEATRSAASDVKIIADAFEELEAAVREISTQTNRAADMTMGASRHAQSASSLMENLSVASERIGTVVGMINEIAKRTNLLALNATIEAARAGEAGRGFTIVARDVKDLASQTAQATGDIEQQVRSVQEVAQSVVALIADVVSSIDQISSTSQAIASAVEQQGVTTSEITQRINDVAGRTSLMQEGVMTVASNVGANGNDARDLRDRCSHLTTDLDQLSSIARDSIARIRAA